MEGILVNENTNKYSENLFSIKSVFDGTITLNKTGGTSLATIGYSEDYKYKAGKSIKSYIYESDEVSPIFNQFNLGDCLSFTAQKDGTYVFSFNALQDYSEVLDGVDKIVVTKFVNSIPQDITFSFQLEDGTNLKRKKWYNFSQSFLLEAGDVLDFSFKHYKEFNSAVTSSTLFLDGFKIELSDRFNGIPTPYSFPVGYYKNPYTGWGYYVDSLATPTITIGTSYTQITIDGLGANITDYLPLEIRGVSQLWSGSKITPIAIGDDYDGRFDLTVTARSGTPTLIELIIDISGTTAGTNVAFTGYIQTGGTIPYKQSIDLDYFTLATFLANGGKLYAKVDTGTITIGRRNIKITRKSKAF
jgi:hypothetical protein